MRREPPNIGVDRARTWSGIYTTGPDAALRSGMLWAFTRDTQIDPGTYVGVTPSHA